jgi:flagellar basal-body rod modification protein FlgD
MSVTSVASTSTSSSQATAATKKNTLTQEDFLKLFTTQMKYQNPLEPLDNFQMATQLAQFNTVDSLTRMNEILNQLVASQNSISHLQAAGLIGKKVEAQGNSLAIQQGTVGEGIYQLARPANVVIQILNSQGGVVRQIAAGSRDASRQAIGWDGKNQAGAALPDGVYTFRVVAVDSQGQSVPVTTYRIGTVEGVSLENGAITLQVNGDKVAFSDILSILN